MFQTFFGSQIDRVVAVAEQSRSLFAKTILVKNLSPDIEIKPQLAVKLVHTVTNVDDAAALGHHPARREYVLPLQLFPINRKGLPAIIQTDFVVDYPSDFSSWQVPDITDVDNGMASICGIEGVNATRLYAQIGALEILVSSSCRLDVALASFPKNFAKTVRSGRISCCRPFQN
jgi:hypothetical protein